MPRKAKGRPARSTAPAAGFATGSIPARAALAAVLGLAGLLALRQVASLDAGFHLAVGNSILAGEGWPQLDRFTYTLTERRYVDTSWGYQVMLAVVERAFGAPGMVLLHAGLVLATLGLVAAAARQLSVDACVVPVLLLIGVLAAELRFQVRPELVSYALLASVLLLLHRHAEGRRSPLWLLPPTFLLWANSHSLYVLGWGALACFVIGLALRDWKIDLRLAGWAGACFPAALINPYGWRGIVFPFTLATRLRSDNPFARAIGEFESPFDLGLTESLPFYPQVPIWSFRLLFALVVLALIPLLLQRRFPAVLLALPFLFLSSKMVRNMPLLVVTSLPLAAAGLRSWARLPRGIERRLRQALPLITLGAVVLLAPRVYHDAYYIASRRTDRLGLGWNELVQPVEAAGWTAQAALPGRMLNHLNFGGYLMWTSERPVFIDGRLEVVGERFFEDYRRALGNLDALEVMVRRWDIGWIIFPFRTNPSLLRRLSDDARWRLVYFDPIAAIFARADRTGPDLVDPSTRSAVARAPGPLELDGFPGLDRSRVGRIEHGLLGLVRRERFPDAEQGRGLFHYFRRDPRRAAPQFAEAVRKSHGAYYELYQNLGAALRRLGHWHEALACYRLVLEGKPSSAVARERVRELEGKLARPVPEPDP